MYLGLRIVLKEYDSNIIIQELHNNVNLKKQLYAIDSFFNILTELFVYAGGIL